MGAMLTAIRWIAAAMTGQLGRSCHCERDDCDECYFSNNLPW